MFLLYESFEEIKTEIESHLYCIELFKKKLTIQALQNSISHKQTLLGFPCCKEMLTRN